MTRRWVIASNVTGPTNRVAECVITATTSCPRFCNPRATSTALYAPMPPVTPSAMRLMLYGPLVRLRFRLELLDPVGDDFLLRDRGLLVLADGDARRRSGEELTRARAGGDHELERVGQLASIN